jgi:hypothetical protein
VQGPLKFAFLRLGRCFRLIARWKTIGAYAGRAGFCSKNELRQDRFVWDQEHLPTNRHSPNAVLVYCAGQRERGARYQGNRPLPGPCQPQHDPQRPVGKRCCMHFGHLCLRASESVQLVVSVMELLAPLLVRCFPLMAVRMEACSILKSKYIPDTPPLFSVARLVLRGT